MHCNNDYCYINVVYFQWTGQTISPPTTTVTMGMLFIGTNSTKDTPTIGTRSLTHSLQRSKRNYACPEESVTYSCVVYGDKPLWKANNDTLGTFDKGGSGFSCNGNGVSCAFQGCFIISGVLDNVTPSTNNDSYPFYYSTLTVTPGYLDNSTSMLIQCTDKPDIQPLNITCGVSGHASCSLPFRVAGIVIHMKLVTIACIIMCVYRNWRGLGSPNIELGGGGAQDIL